MFTCIKCSHFEIPAPSRNLLCSGNCEITVISVTAKFWNSGIAGLLLEFEVFVLCVDIDHLMIEKDYNCLMADSSARGQEFGHKMF